MIIDQEIMASTQMQMNQRNGTGIDNQGRG